MAVIIPGSIVSDIRGSVGTETYARNQGGLYVKTRKGPIDNTGANRDQCRAAITALSQYWSGTLTEQQRTDWRTYAHQHPQADRFGNVHLVNGYTRFIQINFPRYRIDVAVAFPDAPLNPPIHPPDFTFTADDSADTVTIDLTFPLYSGGIQWLQLFAYLGPEVNPGVNFYRGPWRYIGTNRYNTSWQFDPWTLASPWNLTTGQKVFLRMVAQMYNKGELSAPYQTSTIVIA